MPTIQDPITGEELIATEEEVKGEEDRERELLEQFERLRIRVETHLDWCKASSDRQDSERRWRDAQNFWKGKHWDGIKSFGIPGRSAESKRLHPNPVDNFFKAHVEGLLGDICDRPADIQIRPTEQGDDEVAQKMERAVHHVWHHNNADRKLEFIVRRGVLYGPLIAKVFWNPDWVGSRANPYIGEVSIIGVPPPNIFIDPRIKGTDEGSIQEAEFIIYAVRRSLTYIRKNYPEMGHKVSADTYASYVGTLDDGEQDEVSYDDQEVLVIEYWYRGEPRAPEFPMREDDFDVDSDYEGVHVAIVAGGVLLKHTTDIYQKYPFVMEWMYPSDDSIYGYGDAHDILIPQLIINKLNEIALEGADLVTKGNWITEDGNIRDRRAFQRYSMMGGSILPVADINRTTRVHGGNVPGSLFNHYRQEMNAMELISGRTDMAQGRSPRGVRAASAIALLLQQAGGRVRQRARAASSFVRQIAEMVVTHIGENYTDPRLIRVIGSEGEVMSESFSSADIMKTKMLPITDEEGNSILETYDYIPEFDIEVIAGTDTPTSKAYFADLGMQLFDKGLIDDEALLETLQFPRWRQILARKRQMDMMMAQQQAAQQGIPPAGGAPPGGMPPPQGPPPEAGGMMPPQGPPPEGPGGLSPELVQAIVSGQVPPEALAQMGIPPEMIAAITGGQGQPPQGIPPEVLAQAIAQDPMMQALGGVQQGGNMDQIMAALRQLDRGGGI